jgi:hypothetical protein
MGQSFKNFVDVNFASRRFNIRHVTDYNSLNYEIQAVTRHLMAVQFERVQNQYSSSTGQMIGCNTVRGPTMRSLPAIRSSTTTAGAAISYP